MPLEVKSNDELAELVQSFNQMVVDLQELSLVEAGKMPIHLQASYPCRIVEAKASP